MPGKLTYQNVGGLMEGVRAMLGHANFDYEDNRIGPEEVKSVLASSGASTIPFWSEDGFDSDSSTAILRMLGIRLGYYPEAPTTAWEIDSLVDFNHDANPGFFTYIYPFFTKQILPDESKADEWVKGSYGRVCPVYEKRLAGHGKRFLCGDRITIADFKCFSHWLGFSELNPVTPIQTATLAKIEQEVIKYPHVSKWVETMKQELANYIPRRVPTAM